ncbi:hypothetical protein LTR28_010414, partial [Elasticomyces elasticus]
RITVNSQWPGLAEKMGWPAAQYPSAAQELKAVWDANLAPYERYRQTMQAQAQQRSVMAQQQVQQLAGLANRQQASPTRLMTPQGQDGSMTAHAQSMQYSQRPQPQPQQVQHQVYPDQNMPPIRGAPPTMANGYANPQPDPQSMAQQSDLMHHRKTSGVRRTESTPSRQLQTAAPSPSPVLRDKISTPAMSSIATADIKTETAVGEEGMRDLQEDEYVPQARKIDSFGGYDIHDMLAHNGAELARSIPNVPHPEEMGLIDLRAISLSLQSGIHGEVRLALDSLAQISHEHKIELEHCEDLIDALVDCAEDQIDALAEEAPEVSDALDLPSYEDIVRAWRSESEDLQNVPAVGSIEYDLDRAVDRLIAITTILRNVSFYESNHALLTSPPVIKVLSLAIRHLGTRNLLLRTSLNTADFYKDVVVYLSNTAQAIELPSRDDALHILHFLLAFAPQPFPVLPPSSTHDAPPLRFTSYHPITHRYLPAAVDSLAKLLARSDPNRSLYRHIFSATPASHGAEDGGSAPHQLLTRAFALCISVLPDRSQGAVAPPTEMRLVDARKPFLTQAMLAADVLAALAPGLEANVCSAWLGSEDGWVAGLFRLVGLLSLDKGPLPLRGGSGRAPLEFDAQGFALITHRGLGMVRRLVEKSGCGEGGGGVGADVEVGVDGEGEAAGGSEGDGEERARARLLGRILPKREGMLGALVTPSMDKVVLRLLGGLYALAD